MHERFGRQWKKAYFLGPRIFFQLGFALTELTRQRFLPPRSQQVIIVLTVPPLRYTITVLLVTHNAYL